MHLAQLLSEIGQQGTSVVGKDTDARYVSIVGRTIGILMVRTVISGVLWGYMALDRFQLETSVALLR